MSTVFEQFHRPAERLSITVDASTARERGRQRGRALSASLATAWDTYTQLFAASGIAADQVRWGGEDTVELLGRVLPAQAEELEGIAETAGLELWKISALNARTEVLAASVKNPPKECSTLVRRAPTAHGPTTFGVQTWDWHVELANYWHLIDSRGGKHSFVGITEHGILGKIGVNDAGVALHFNILGHQQDRLGGVPMHVLAAHVLEEADSADHAADLVRSLPIHSSGSFALFDTSTVRLLDLSPVGVFEVPPVAENTWVRTNHFLTAEPAREEKSWLYQPDSGERYDLLRSRVLEQRPASGEEAQRLLISGAGEAALTCVPDPSLGLGERWASLATVALDPVSRTARVLDGTPAESGRRPVYVLTVGTSLEDRLGQATRAAADAPS